MNGIRLANITDVSPPLGFCMDTELESHVNVYVNFSDPFSSNKGEFQLALIADFVAVSTRSRGTPLNEKKKFKRI